MLTGILFKGLIRQKHTGKEIEGLIDSGKTKGKILTLKEYVESGQAGKGECKQ